MVSRDENLKTRNHLGVLREAYRIEVWQKVQLVARH
jgi:hypothetical protein